MLNQLPRLKYHKQYLNLILSLYKGWFLREMNKTWKYEFIFRRNCRSFWRSSV